MADFDYAGLLQNPMFMAGLQGLLANPQDRGRAMLQGAQAAQGMAGTQQLQQMRALQLQQAQNAANFNPQDYMKTTPIAPGTGTATPDALAQLGQAPLQPAALSGPLGGQMSMQPPPPVQAPIQPQPGTPTGRVDMPALLQAGMQAGMQPGEIQGLAGLMDPQTAAQMQLAGKFEKLGPGEIGVNGLGTQIAANSNLPNSSPVVIIDQLTKARDAAVAAGDTRKAAAYDDMLQKYNGGAEQDYRNTEIGFRRDMIGLARQRLEGNPEDIEARAQAIAAGHLPMPTGYGANSPMGMALARRVMEINPGYDAKNYVANQQALKDFQSGKNGNTVRSLNVVIQHLDTLGSFADALGNGDMQAVNKIGNAIATQTGKTAPTNFNAVKPVVADELVKAIIGSGGGVTDRVTAEHAVNDAQSIQQLHGVIQSYQKLLGGQLSGLQQQYEQASGRQDFDRFLSPTTKAVLGGVQGKTVVRTGTANGRKVVQYSDGTTEYAD